MIASVVAMSLSICALFDDNPPTEAANAALVGPDDQVFYQHAPRLGTVTLVTDKAGEVVSRRAASPYGVKTGHDGQDPEEFSFTGKEWDDDTGYVYFGARYYDPSLGRWISADPLYLHSATEAGDKLAENNLYGYVLNNPVQKTDPDGLDPLGMDYIRKEIAIWEQAIRDFPEYAYNGTVGALTSDETQITLDVVGTTEIPLVSQGADLGSAGISAYKGRWSEAGIGVVAMVPGVSALKWADEGSELFVKVTREAAGAKQVQKAKQAQKTVIEKGFGISKAPQNVVEEALQNYKNRHFKMGGDAILLDQGDMKHILERHHPKYWDGSVGEKQSFFPKGASMSDITDTLKGALNQGCDRRPSVEQHFLEQEKMAASPCPIQRTQERC